MSICLPLLHTEILLPTALPFTVSPGSPAAPLPLTTYEIVGHGSVHMPSNTTALPLGWLATGKQGGAPPSNFNKPQQSPVEEQALQAMRRRDFDRALSLYVQALREQYAHGVTSPKTLCDVGICLRELREYDRAIGAFSRSLSIKWHGRTLCERGIAYVASGQLPS